MKAYRFIARSLPPNRVRKLHQACRICVNLIAEDSSRRHYLRAASLTIVTLLALIPLVLFT